MSLTSGEVIDDVLIQKLHLPYYASATGFVPGIFLYLP
jgi:hypothetical protein